MPDTSSQIFDWKPCQTLFLDLSLTGIRRGPKQARRERWTITETRLYNSFIMSHFHYCSSIWHHCLKSDSKKLDRLHERALHYLYSDDSSQTSPLFDRIGYSLVDRRIQNLLIIVFKPINNIIHLNIWETYLD